MALDYLFSSAVLIAILALVASGAHAVFSSGRLALDARDARSFVLDVSSWAQGGSQASSLSRRVFEVSPLSRWQIELEGSVLRVRVGASGERVAETDLGVVAESGSWAIDSRSRVVFEVSAGRLRVAGLDAHALD